MNIPTVADCIRKRDDCVRALANTVVFLAQLIYQILVVLFEQNPVGRFVRSFIGHIFLEKPFWAAYSFRKFKLRSRVILTSCAIAWLCLSGLLIAIVTRAELSEFHIYSISIYGTMYVMSHMICLSLRRERYYR